MPIYVVEFDGSAKGSYQRAYLTVQEIYEDWIKIKEDLQRRWAANTLKYPEIHAALGDQDLFFTIRITKPNHEVGPRQKVVFDENGTLVKVSVKKINTAKEGYIANRWKLSGYFAQYQVTRKETYLTIYD